MPDIGTTVSLVDWSRVFTRATEHDMLDLSRVFVNITQSQKEEILNLDNENLIVIMSVLQHVRG
jgi:hypothetical protein